MRHVLTSTAGPAFLFLFKPLLKLQHWVITTWLQRYFSWMPESYSNSR